MVEDSFKILDFVEKTVSEEKIDTILHGGDLMDRGYDVVKSEHLIELVRKLSKINKMVDGRMYINIGNHELTYNKDNLFYDITEIYNDKFEGTLNYKISKTDTIENLFINPSYLLGDKVLIYFLGYDKKQRYKIPDELSEGRKVIALFHDSYDSAISRQYLIEQLYQNGIKMDTTDVFNNIDIALFGHIHTPIEPFTINNSRNTLVITPGSTITRTVSEIHQEINLPILDINEETGDVGISYVTYTLPDYSTVFLKEVVDKNSANYQFSKILDKDKTIHFNRSNLLESIYEKIEDPRIISIIKKADTILESELMNEYKEMKEGENRNDS